VVYFVKDVCLLLFYFRFSLLSQKIGWKERLRTDLVGCKFFTRLLTHLRNLDETSGNSHLPLVRFYRILEVSGQGHIRTKYVVMKASTSTLGRRSQSSSYSFCDDTMTLQLRADYLLILCIALFQYAFS